MPKALGLRFEQVPESPGGLVKTWFPRLHSRASDSIALWWGLRTGISHKLPGDDDAYAAGHLQKHWLKPTELLSGRTKPGVPSTPSPVC